MTRYVALDLETTSLDTHRAYPLEIAAVEVTPDDDPGVYGAACVFVPHTDRSVINAADDEALAVNRWYERRLFDHMASPDGTRAAIGELVAMLDGATLVGANPAYDAAVLWRWLRAMTDYHGTHDLESPPWHFRLYDVEVATAAALGLDRIPGLAKCADLWSIDTDPSVAHTAAGDAFLTADVFNAVYRHNRSDGDVEELTDWGGRAIGVRHESETDE